MLFSPHSAYTSDDASETRVIENSHHDDDDNEKRSRGGRIVLSIFLIFVTLGILVFVARNYIRKKLLSQRGYQDYETEMTVRGAMYIFMLI